ncbi:MAG: peptide chain release factor N(5)-glutamine methyltransferase [Lachnospiraceae bacterium]|nr:peptide chain release factor N(5)-glutamine methyltransferase [Lachnospiraceae bacterium]
MLYSEAKKKAAAVLSGVGIEEADVDAEYLLQCASGFERNELFIRWNEEMPADIEKKFEELIERRSSHEPLQYIIGNQDFMGYMFIVTPDVLIPRFDTEILAELAVKRAEKAFFELNERALDGSLEVNEFRILDLCTGSGCVAVSTGLALEERILGRTAFPIKNIDVTGADISPAAVALARKNWEYNKEHRIHERNTDIRPEGNGVQINAGFTESDLFGSINGRFHIITANPPYIVRDEIKTLMPEITEHEPHLALDGGADGMDFYRIIVREAPEYLYPGGRLMMEFDDSQAEPVAKMMDAAGFKEIEVHRDLAHLRRVIEGKFD